MEHRVIKAWKFYRVGKGDLWGKLARSFEMHSIRVCRVNFQRLKYSLEIYPASDAHEICRLDSISLGESGKCWDKISPKLRRFSSWQRNESEWCFKRLCPNIGLEIDLRHLFKGIYNVLTSIIGQMNRMPRMQIVKYFSFWPPKNIYHSGQVVYWDKLFRNADRTLSWFQ